MRKINKDLKLNKRIGNVYNVANAMQCTFRVVVRVMVTIMMTMMMMMMIMNIYITFIHNFSCIYLFFHSYICFY